MSGGSAEQKVLPLMPPGKVLSCRNESESYQHFCRETKVPKQFLLLLLFLLSEHQSEPLHHQHLRPQLPKGGVLGAEAARAWAPL